MTGAGVAGTRAGVAVTGADVAARVRLAVLPTPLVPAPRLAEVVGAGALYVKRDDLTGFAFAGNKGRPLEFLLAAAPVEGADTLLTTPHREGRGFRPSPAGVPVSRPAAPGRSRNV